MILNFNNKEKILNYLQDLIHCKKKYLNRNDLARIFSCKHLSVTAMFKLPGFPVHEGFLGYNNPERKFTGSHFYVDKTELINYISNNLITCENGKLLKQLIKS